MDDLIGSWKLLSFQIEDTAGVKRDWQGGGAEGILIYSKAGLVSVAINASPATFKQLKNPEELLERSLFYAGTYTVKGNEIIHQVQLAINPARIGETMIRSFELKDKNLTLKGSGEYGASIILWERILCAK